MKVGVVGAGAAGLATARTLAEKGISAVVFEKSDHPGGRCATHSVDGFVFDSGATSIAPRGRALERAMLEILPQNELVLVEPPMFVHEGLRTYSGDPAINRLDRYAYRSGNAHLGRLLADGVEVRYGELVETLEKSSEGYRIAGEIFDAVVLAVPAPRAAELLASIGEFRPLANVRYRMCLSVMLGYRLPAPTQAYHALIDPDQRHPLTWLSLESVKCPSRAPEGCTALVCQLGPQFSAMRFGDPDDSIVAAAAVYVARLYGKEWETPEISAVKRWRYSQPEMTAGFETVNHAKATLVVAGDSVMGARVEFAYESGVAAAELLAGRAQ